MDVLENGRGVKVGREKRMETEWKAGTSKDWETYGCKVGRRRKYIGEEIDEDDWKLQTRICGIFSLVE